MRVYVKININDIRISEMFSRTKPREEKMKFYRDTYEKYKAFRKLPVLDKNNYLVDGYIPYLLMKEYGYENVVVLKDYNYNSKTKSDKDFIVYVYGIHIEDKEGEKFVWKIPNNSRWDKVRRETRVGSTIMCNTVQGKKPVIVTSIIVSDIPPREGKIKTVVADSESILIR